MDRVQVVATRRVIKTALPIFVSQTLHFLNKAAGLQAHSVCDEARRKSRLIPLPITSCLPTEHPMPLSIYLSLEKAVALAIFRRMVAEEMPEDAGDATAREVLDETLNTIVGNCTERLAQAGISLEVFPPFSTHLCPLTAQPLKPAAAIFACPIDTSAGKVLFWLQPGHPAQRDDEEAPGDGLNARPVEPPRFTVVVADDSAIVRKAVRKAVNACGGEIVAEAVDGIDAVQAYQRHLPDVLLLDITMPRMDGIRAARQILTQWPEATIVMATSINREATVAEARALGVQHYLLKPFSEEVLRRAITAVLGVPFACIGECRTQDSPQEVEGEREGPLGARELNRSAARDLPFRGC